MLVSILLLSATIYYQNKYNSLDEYDGISYLDDTNDSDDDEETMGDIIAKYNASKNNVQTLVGVLQKGNIPDETIRDIINESINASNLLFYVQQMDENQVGKDLIGLSLDDNMLVIPEIQVQHENENN